jgi:outer membrane protein OmpA-like peptidoglycan-associated protein
MPITVNPTGFVPVAPTLPATALPTGTVGTPYNVTLPVTGGTAPGPYAIACSGTPPAGLTVTPSTTSLGSNVVISGTPTIAGVTADAVNCTVTDSTGLTSTSILPLTIDVPQVIIPTPPGAPVVVAVATPAVTPASAVTATTATLNGTIDPSGTAITSEEFCYIQGSTLVDCQGAMIDPIVPLTLPAGTTTTALSGVVSGLIANSPYCYQLETTNAVSTYYSAPECFTTLATNASTPVTPAVILPSSLRYITHFAENRSTLTASDKVTIHALAAFIVAHKDLHDALIGYTDPLYTKAYNLALGERRAMSVAVQLKKDLAAMGVSNVSTKAASGGATDYVVVGLSNSARAKDRRVTVSVN